MYKKLIVLLILIISNGALAGDCVKEVEAFKNEYWESGFTSKDIQKYFTLESICSSPNEKAYFGYMLMLLHMKNENYREALDAFNSYQANDISPNLEDVFEYNGISNHYYFGKQNNITDKSYWESANKKYQEYEKKALKIRAGLYIKRAQIYIELNQADQATLMIEKGLKVAEDNIEKWKLNGLHMICKYMKEDYEGAVILAQDVIPKSERGFYYEDDMIITLIKSLLFIGDTKSARQMLNNRYALVSESRNDETFTKLSSAIDKTEKYIEEKQKKNESGS